MIRLNDGIPVDCPGSLLAREPDCRSAVPDSYQRCSCRCRPRPISRIPAISLYQLSAVTTRSIAHTSEGQTEAYTLACLQILSKRQQRASPKVQKQNRLWVYPQGSVPARRYFLRQIDVTEIWLNSNIDLWEEKKIHCEIQKAPIVSPN